MENHFEKGPMIRDSVTRIKSAVESAAFALKKSQSEIYEAIGFDIGDYEADLLAKPDIFTHKTFTQDVAHLKYCEDVMAEKLSEYVDSLNEPIDSRNPSRFTFLKDIAAYTTPLKKLGMLGFSLGVVAAITGISGCIGQTPTTSGLPSTNAAAAPHQQIFGECAKNFKPSTYQSMTDAQLNQFAIYIESGQYTDPVNALQKVCKSATSVSKLDNAKIFMKEAAALFANSKAWDVNQQLTETDQNCYAELETTQVVANDGTITVGVPYGSPSEVCSALAQNPTYKLLIKGKNAFECFAKNQAGKALEKLSKRYLAVIEAELLEYDQDSPVGNLLHGVLNTPTATTAVATTAATTPAVTTAVATTTPTAASTQTCKERGTCPVVDGVKDSIYGDSILTGPSPNPTDQAKEQILKSLYAVTDGKNLYVFMEMYGNVQKKTTKYDISVYNNEVCAYGTYRPYDNTSARSTVAAASKENSMEWLVKLSSPNESECIKWPERQRNFVYICNEEGCATGSQTYIIDLSSMWSKIKRI